MSQVYTLSVHDIVDLLLRRGHLDTRVFNQSSMQEGTKLHARYQKEQGDDYYSEYPLSYEFQNEGMTFKVFGKADGVIFKDDGEVIVEEIKTTVDDLDNFIHDHGEWHLGQAMFYAYILSKQKSLKSVTILMTYIKQNNYRLKKHITKKYTDEELSRFVADLILRFTHIQKKIQRMKIERNMSTKDLTFPFSHFREGQKDAIDFVEKAAEEKKEVFIEAPTGIGKTISVLYPLVKRFYSKKADKIFYLTSKNSIKKIAVNAMSLFINQGVKTKTIEFTSKENICFNDKKGHCNPDECPFAKYYYDKLVDVIFDNLECADLFDRKKIEEIAYKNQMCPFQLQLDFSAYCDVLICDYSYVYDYHDLLNLEESNIKNTHAFLLVDECHNLPDRVRDMYSIELFLSDIKKALEFCISPAFEMLRSDLTDLIYLIEHMNLEDIAGNIVQSNLVEIKKIPTTITDDIDDCLVDMKDILKKSPSLVDDAFLEFFYSLNSFAFLAKLAEDDSLHNAFYCYVTKYDNEINSIRIMNLDSRPLINEGSSNFESTVYFSATLSPKNYYIDLLGGDKNDLSNRLILNSPFPLENRKIFFDTNLSLRYKDRDATLYSVYSLIKSAIASKQGNYFVFCPSFDYLERLYSFFDQEKEENVSIITQSRFMKESDKQSFLENFKTESEKTTVGLLVLGGVFSEGIDLVGDRLIGAIIISVGLPQLNFERDRLKDYFNQDDVDSQLGFLYAYTYPGINKVLQAAGRVIRSENDMGFVLFIDSRYKQKNYYDIMKEIYPDATTIVSPSQLKMKLRTFWKEKDKNEL